MSQKDRMFLAYWDCFGFECLIDITSYERQKLLSDIKGEQLKNPVNLSMLTLRARCNPQRKPEIWIFTSEVDEATLQTFAEEQPQVLVDLIRSHGKNLFKTKEEEQKIK